MKQIVLSSLVISSVLFAGVENMIPSFSDFDSNRDGKVTKSEFETAQAQRMKKQSESGRMMKNVDNAPSFESMDINKDTFVDTLEFSEHQVKHRAKMRANKEQGK